jgi:hypothetical protein
MMSGHGSILISKTLQRMSLSEIRSLLATRPNEIVRLIEEASNAAAAEADHEVAGDLQR